MNGARPAGDFDRILLQVEAVARLSRDDAAGDLEGVMQAVVRDVNQLLGSDLCILFRMQPAGDTLTAAAAVSTGEGKVGNFSVPAGGDSRQGYTLAAAEPVVVDDYRTEDRFAVPACLRVDGAITGLSVTVRGRDRPFGTLTADSKRSEHFSNYDVSFFQTVANVLAGHVQRRQAEDALRRSETGLRKVLSTELIGMMKWSTDGRVTDANDALLGLVGYERRELESGRVRWTDLTPEEYRRADEHALAEIRQKGNCTAYEKEFVRKDGGRVPVLIGAVLLEGEVDQGFAFVLDLTEVKRGQTATSRLEAIIEGSDDAFVGEDREGRVIGWNPGAERLYGYPAEEVVGRSISVLVPPDRIAEMAELKARVWRGERLHPFDTVRRRKDGSLIDVSVSMSPVRDRAGRVVAVSKIAHDIGSRKRAEADLRLRDRAIRAISSGIVITDPRRPDNPIIYVSPGFERLTGYSAGEAVGRNCRFLQGKDTDRGAAAQLREAAQAGGQCDVELLNYRKDGTPFWNQLSVSPVLDAAARPSHFIGVMTDVTDRRRLEAQFQQAQKMEAVGRLAGGVAHDFNNLLTIISGYSDALLQDLPPGDPSRELVAEIHAAGERAGTLTKQLLMFSRQSVLETKVLSINAVVADIEKMLARLIGEDVRLTTDLAPDLAPVRADPGQLQQALVNLAVNARDAMPQGGELTVETRDVELAEEQCAGVPGGRPGRYSMLAVTDTGTGMDEATKARIFEPFFTTKEAGKGTGLGLAMVYGFVKSSGGHIGVDSEPGRGTTFRVYFPQVHERLSSGKPPPGVGRMPRGTETVLLVEDDDSLRALTRYVLRSGGYTVLEAPDGREAVRQAEGHRGPIHLLVTDVVMPDMGGRQVAERVGALRPGIKVIYCSGYTDDAVIRHGVLKSETAFVQKPYSPASLAQKVRDVLDSER